MSVTWKNAARFKAKLSKLPKVVETAARAAMEDLAQQIVDSMKRLVPVESGTLRDSINWCWGDPPAGSRFMGSVARKTGGGVNGNKISIFAGGEEAYYARWVEFGTKEHAAGSYRDKGGRKRNAGARGHAGTPAEPFFYPVFRAYKRKLGRSITIQVNKAIKELAASQNGN